MTTLAQKDDLQTVEHVDLKRSAGVWFEVVKCPNKFQTHCVDNTIAIYELLGNWEIRVVNSS